jgi:hypothetical protein
MKSKYAINRTQVVDAFRAAGALLVLQGLLFGVILEAPQLLSWAKGSVLIGLLFWAGASLVKQQDY